MKVTATIERITPTTAKTYLEKMCENRKPKEATIAMYANDMQSENWLLTPQGIAFDQGERLFDGQHRMLAWDFFASKQGGRFEAVRKLFQS